MKRVIVVKVDLEVQVINMKEDFSYLYVEDEISEDNAREKHITLSFSLYNEDRLEYIKQHDILTVHDSHSGSCDYEVKFYYLSCGPANSILRELEHMVYDREYNPTETGRVEYVGMLLSALNRLEA